MEDINSPRGSYVAEIVELIKSHLTDPGLPELLSDYHENDIADALGQLSPEERKTIYPLLGAEYVAEIFSYLEDV